MLIKNLLKKYKMFKIPLYGKKKLVMAMEYGVILATVAKDRNIELTPEIVARLEDIVVKEFTDKSYERVSLDMIVNILASLEIKE